MHSLRSSSSSWMEIWSYEELDPVFVVLDVGCLPPRLSNVLFDVSAREPLAAFGQRVG